MFHNLFIGTHSKQVTDYRILVLYLFDDARCQQIRTDLRQQQPGISAPFLRAERRDEPVHQHLTCGTQNEYMYVCRY